MGKWNVFNQGPAMHVPVLRALRIYQFQFVDNYWGPASVPLQKGVPFRPPTDRVIFRFNLVQETMAPGRDSNRSVASVDRAKELTARIQERCLTTHLAPIDGYSFSTSQYSPWVGFSFTWLQQTFAVWHGLTTCDEAMVHGWPGA